MGRYYPASLDLTARRCVVVGGGELAHHKILGLLEAGGDVVVISDAPIPAVDTLEAQGCVKILRRPYRRGDLRGAVLAIAVGDRAEHPAIWDEAVEERVLLNAVDNAPYCHFIAPAIHRQGDLAIAISTGGKSPALAVRLRNRIAGCVGPEYGQFLEILGTMRSAIAAREPDPARRTALRYRIVDSDALELLRCGDAAGARQHLSSLLRAGSHG